MAGMSPGSVSEEGTELGVLTASRTTNHIIHNDSSTHTQQATHPNQQVMPQVFGPERTLDPHRGAALCEASASVGWNQGLKTKRWKSSLRATKMISVSAACIKECHIGRVGSRCSRPHGTGPDGLSGLAWVTVTTSPSRRSAASSTRADLTKSCSGTTPSRFSTSDRSWSKSQLFGSVTSTPGLPCAATVIRTAISAPARRVRSKTPWGDNYVRVSGHFLSAQLPTKCTFDKVGAVQKPKLHRRNFQRRCQGKTPTQVKHEDKCTPAVQYSAACRVVPGRFISHDAWRGATRWGR